LALNITQLCHSAEFIKCHQIVASVEIINRDQAMEFGPSTWLGPNCVVRLEYM